MTMTRPRRSTKNTNAKLMEQLNILRNLAESFDSGHINMAIPMATSVRVLIHQTNNSTSLLHQLDLEDKFKLWHSPNTSFSPNNLLTTWSLLSLSLTYGSASYLPLGSKEVFNKQIDTSNKVRPEIFLPIELWWNQIVFSQQSDRILRRDIVLFIANKDGGAHISEEIWPIDDYKESLLLGFVNQDGDAPDGNPLYYAMRQIVEEILLSFEFFNTHHFKTTPSFKQKIEFLNSSENNSKHLYFNFLRDLNDKSNDSNSFQIRDFVFKYYYYDQNNLSFIDDNEKNQSDSFYIIEVK